jgi:type III secretion protein Q
MQEHFQSAAAGGAKSASIAAVELSMPCFPGMPAQDVTAANLWYRSRRPVMFEAAGLALKFAAAPYAPAPSQEPCQHIGLTVGGKRAYLAVSARLVSTVLQSYGLPASQVLPEHTILLLLEHRFAGAIEACEERLNLPVTLTDLGTRSDSPEVPLVPLCGKLSLSGEDYWIGLHLPPDLAIALGKVLNAAQGKLRAEWPVPVTLASRVALTQLTLGALKKVRPGDVILADRTAGPGRAFLVAGERLAASGVWRDRTVILQEHPRKIASIDGGAWRMSSAGTFDGMPAAGDAELDDIQIRVCFELGRKEVPLGELRSLIPGYVFDLNRDQRTAIDIYAGTQRVGCGEIVQINGALGVRVTRLFNNE